MNISPSVFQHIVVLTGAGISAESGLATFRDDGGTWEKHRIEDVASPQAFEKNPQQVLDFYNMRRLRAKEVIPNLAHVALAQFEKNFAGTFVLVTQNVDDLHQRAGNKNIFPMHGELTSARCTSCHALSSVLEIQLDSICPNCHHRGRLRPHIVWFGEMPLFLPQIYLALEQCDLFVAIGTSGTVYPAADFVNKVRRNRKGAKTVLLNKEESENSWMFDQIILGPATQIVPQFFRA